MSAPTLFSTIDSPIGELYLTATDGGLTAVYFDTPRRKISSQWLPDGGKGGRASAVLGQTRKQLAAYFAGTLTTFDLPLVFAGTEFQERVWHALQTVAFGQSTSYGALARQIGAPSAPRAVGAANGRNPIPIIVPCHRVIGSTGALTGFGGGIHRKQWLLDHERGVLSELLGEQAAEQRTTAGGKRRRRHVVANASSPLSSPQLALGLPD
jgi:methylated-DNA-[protein]-cysteine S-methyltransferase